MTSDSEIIHALEKACTRAGTQKALAQKAGMGAGRISDYLKGRCEISNITLQTLRKLFPELQMHFFADEKEGQHYSKELEAIKLEYSEKLKQLEKDIKLFELEKENYRLRRENEELKKESLLKIPGR